jgi:plasmid stabilization system protein ParE
MARAIIILSKAEADIRRIAMRIARSVSSASALRWHAGILTKVRSLSHDAEIWPTADEAADLGLDLRQALYGKRRHVYRILYTFTRSSVQVHRVRHAAQDRLTPDEI